MKFVLSGSHNLGVSILRNINWCVSSRGACTSLTEELFFVLRRTRANSIIQFFVVPKSVRTRAVPLATGSIRVHSLIYRTDNILNLFLDWINILWINYLLVLKMGLSEFQYFIVAKTYASRRGVLMMMIKASRLFGKWTLSHGRFSRTNAIIIILFDI